MIPVYEIIEWWKDGALSQGELIIQLAQSLKEEHEVTLIKTSLGPSITDDFATSLQYAEKNNGIMKTLSSHGGWGEYLVDRAIRVWKEAEHGK